MTHLCTSLNGDVGDVEWPLAGLLMTVLTQQKQKSEGIARLSSIESEIKSEAEREPSLENGKII